MPRKKNGQLMRKRPELPDGCQRRGFKGSGREGSAGCMISSCTIPRLVGIKVKFKHHQLFGFNQSRVYVLVVTIFIWFCFLQKQLRNLCQAFIYIFQGTGSSDDSTMWRIYSLNCYKFPGPTANLCFYIFTFLISNS